MPGGRRNESDRRIRGRHADESSWRDTDDRVIARAYPERRSKDIRLSAVPRLPGFIAKDRDSGAGGRPVIGGTKEAPYRRSGMEEVEESATDDFNRQLAHGGAGPDDGNPLTVLRSSCER